jgi:hypothetical protein
LREEGDDMRGPPIGVGRREVKVPVQGGKKMGRGLEWIPGSSFIFFFFLLFSFSVFPISFADFVKCSKSHQTSFRNFVKFTARF